VPDKDNNKPKTYKREVGMILLVYIMVLGWFGDFRVLEVLAWPFVAFALGAFGIDSYSKQVNKLPPPTRKHDDWEDK
jgi:hypothetical protein